VRSTKKPHKKNYPPLLWQLEPLPEFSRTLKQVSKKNKTETTQLLENLNAIHEALNIGVKPGCLHGGHIHREPHGIIAVDQKGAKGSNRELRLYTYPCDKTSTLYMLKIGDKGSQKRDIKWCKEIVEKLPRENYNEC